MREYPWSKRTFQGSKPIPIRFEKCSTGAYDGPATPKWRNWQTRRTQNPVPFGACGFDSHLRHWIRGVRGPDRSGPRTPTGYGRKFSVSGSGPAIGVSNSGPAPSGSIVTAPPPARNVAICCCAAKASGPEAPPMLLRNVCGFLTV